MLEVLPCLKKLINYKVSPLRICNFFWNEMWLLHIVLIFRTWCWTWLWTWLWTRFGSWFWTWVWTWFWARTQVGTPILFHRSNSLASVSILPVFSRLVLDFILRSSIIRMNVWYSNKLVIILHLKWSALIMLLKWDYWYC